MAVIDPADKLIQEKLDLNFGEEVLFGRKVFFEVVIGVLENEIDFAFLHFIVNVLQPMLKMKSTG